MLTEFTALYFIYSTFLKTSIDIFIFVSETKKKKFSPSRVLSAQERVTGSCIWSVESISRLKSIWRTKWKYWTRNWAISRIWFWQWLTEKSHFIRYGFISWWDISKKDVKGNLYWKISTHTILVKRIRILVCLRLVENRFLKHFNSF